MLLKCFNLNWFLSEFRYSFIANIKVPSLDFISLHWRAPDSPPCVWHNKLRRLCDFQEKLGRGRSCDSESNLKQNSTRRDVQEKLLHPDDYRFFDYRVMEIWNNPHTPEIFQSDLSFLQCLQETAGSSPVPSPVHHLHLQFAVCLFVCVSCIKTPESLNQLVNELFRRWVRWTCLDSGKDFHEELLETSLDLLPCPHDHRFLN